MIAGRAKARSIERFGNLSVGLAARSEFKGPLQAGCRHDCSRRWTRVVANRLVEDGDSVGSLCHAEGEKSVVEPLRLALALALLCFSGQIVRVELREPD